VTWWRGTGEAGEPRLPEVRRLQRVHQKRSRRGVDVAVWRRRKEVGDVAALALRRVGAGAESQKSRSGAARSTQTVGACASRRCQERLSVGVVSLACGRDAARLVMQVSTFT
jgi:hypothetical protein